MPLAPRLNLRTYAGTRTTAPAPVNGRRVPGVETPLVIRANLQPVGRRINALPEAKRTDDMRFLFTTTELYTAGRVVGGTRYDADKVTISGTLYSVIQVDEWPGHYEVFLARGATP